MPKKYIISEKQQEEINTARRLNKDKNAEKRLEVLELRAKGLKDQQIAEKTGFHKKYVSALVVKYKKEGLEAIIHTKHGGNRRNIGLEEEKELLAEFVQKAQKGQIITIKEIEAKYNELIGHECGSGTIYKLLIRHGWRKVMPRSKHPNKASEEAIEASKKLTQLSGKREWKILTQEESD